LKILIIQPYRYGDILQMQPVIKSITEKFEGCKIHYLADDYFSEILGGCPYIDRVIVFPKMKCVAEMKYRENFRNGNEILDKFIDELQAEKYDIVINFNLSRSAAFCAYLAQGASKYGRLINLNGESSVSGDWTRYLLSFTGKRVYNSYNLVDLFYRMAEDAMGLPEGGLKRQGLFFWADDNDREAADCFIRKNKIKCGAAGIQVGASKKYRMILNDRYHELVKSLNADGLDVVLFGGPGESAEAEKIIAACGSGARVFNSCGAFSIRQNYAMLSRLDIFVTVDTLNMHLAAAAGAKVLAVFYGEAYPYETGAYAGGVYFAYSPIPCSPCADADKCGHSMECLGKDTMNVIHGFIKTILNKEVEEMEQPNGLSLYMTGINADMGYTLELMRGIEPPGETVNGVMKEIYRNFWEGVFVEGEENTAIQGVDGIWEEFADKIMLSNEKGEMVRLFKTRAGEYIKMSSLVNEGIACLEQIKKNAASGGGDIRGVFELINEKMQQTSPETRMLGAYYKIKVSEAAGSYAMIRKVYEDLRCAVNTIIFAMTYMMQKIHETALLNSEELTIV
jgi:ADP-heptose:LPS heptosyltransferase